MSVLAAPTLLPNMVLGCVLMQLAINMASILPPPAPHPKKIKNTKVVGNTSSYQDQLKKMHVEKSSKNGRDPTHIGQEGTQNKAPIEAYPLS